MPNFVKISQIIAGIWLFFLVQDGGRLHFGFKMAAVCHLGFMERILGPPIKSNWRSLLSVKIWLDPFKSR